MKIVVTGAYGQLGGELGRRLGREAIGLDVDTLDLAAGPAVREAILRLAPELVLHCGAYTQVDRAESEPDLCRAVNVTAVEHLAEACQRLGATLVHISTDYVFGGQPERTVPFREDDPPSPHGVYAQTKLDGERVAARAPKHLIVRTCGLYAHRADDRAKNFVRTILRIGRERGRVRVVADQQCTPSYVPHVADALLFLAGVTAPRPAPWGVYHVTNQGGTTWCEFTRAIFRNARVDVVVEPITSAEYPSPVPRPAYSVLDTSRYHGLGGPAMPAWEAAIAEYFS